MTAVRSGRRHHQMLFLFTIAIVSFVSATSSHLSNVSETIKSTLEMNKAFGAIDKYMGTYMKLLNELEIDDRCLEASNVGNIRRRNNSKLSSQSGDDDDDNDVDIESKLNRLPAFDNQVSGLENDFNEISSKLQTIRLYSKAFTIPDDIFELIKRGRKSFMKYLNEFFTNVNASLREWMKRLLIVLSKRLGMTIVTPVNQTETMLRFKSVFGGAVTEPVQLHSYEQINMFVQFHDLLTNCTNQARKLCFHVFASLPELKELPLVNQNFCKSYSIILKMSNAIKRIEHAKRLPIKPFEQFTNEELIAIRHRVTIEEQMGRIKPLEKFLDNIDY